MMMSASVQLAPPGGPASGYDRRVLLALYAAAIITFSVTVTNYLGSRFRFDEAEWPPQVTGILKHGVPKLQYSEERRIFVHPDHGYDAHYGMWHPPVYLYSLAFSARLFGLTNASLRGVGLAFFLISLWLVYNISAALGGPSWTGTGNYVPVAIAMLSPVLVEGGLYLDIDNTCLAAGVLLFVWQFVTPDNGRPARRLLRLTLILTLCLWMKMTTPYILIGTVVLYHWLNRQFKRGFVEGVVVGGGATVLFLLSYWTYCKVTHYPPEFMFAFSYWGKRSAYTSLVNPRTVLVNARWALAWTSIPITILIATSLYTRAIRYLRQRSLELIDFPLLFCITCTLVYAVLWQYPGKYIVPGIWCGIVSAGYYLRLSLARADRNDVNRWLLAVGALTAVHIIAIRSIRIKPSGAYVYAMTWFRVLSDERNVYLVASIAVFALCYFVMRYFMPRHGVGGTGAPVFCLAAAAYLIAANSVDSLKVAFVLPEGSPYRTSVDAGFGQTIEYLNGLVEGSDTVIVPKDMGYYLRSKYHPTETLVQEGLGSTKLSDVRFVVDSVVNSSVPMPLLAEWGMTQSKRIGDFIVSENKEYKPRSANPRSLLRQPTTETMRLHGGSRTGVQPARCCAAM